MVDGPDGPETNESGENQGSPPLGSTELAGQTDVDSRIQGDVNHHNADDDSAQNPSGLELQPETDNLPAGYQSSLGRTQLQQKRQQRTIKTTGQSQTS